MNDTDRRQRYNVKFAKELEQVENGDNETTREQRLVLQRKQGADILEHTYTFE